METNNVKSSNVFSLFKTLTNFTKEDLENLKLIASGRYSKNEAPQDPQSKSFLDIVERVFSRNSYNYGDNSPQTRKQLYEIYDEMDNEVSYISAALDILSDDATQPNEDGSLITIITDSDKVFSICENFLQEFGIEEKLPMWARIVAKYGDYFIRVHSKEGEGVVKIVDSIYPSDVERLDYDGELIAFSDTSNLSNNNDVCPPWEYVHFKHKGDVLANKGNSENRLIHDDSEYDLSSTYGMSVLRPAIKVYAQLRFVENMILLSRLTNSVRRNIFMINVGEVSPDKSFETIENYANLLKKNIDLNLESGIFNAQKKTIPYDEDIFIPVADPKNDVRIEQVGGDVNISEQYDLEYLLNKLFSALKIPKAYLNYEQDLNARATLIQLDIRYARSVSGLQHTLRNGLLRLLNINLAFNGLDPNSVNLDIQLPPVSTIDAETKRQDMLNKVEVANSVWRTLTDINDKMSGKPNGGSSDMGGFGAMLGSQSNESSDDTSLDMKYAAELILSEYMGFSKEETSKLLKNVSNDTEEDKSKNAKRITFRKVKSSDPDLYAPYPTNEGKLIYERLRESINIQNFNKKKGDTKTYEQSNT